MRGLKQTFYLFHSFFNRNFSYFILFTTIKKDDKKQEVKMASTEAGYKLSQAPTECRQINQPGASIGGSGNHEPTLFSIQIDQPQLESELTRNLPDKPLIETDIGSLELALTE